MKVRERIITRFEVEDGDTIPKIVEALRRAPRSYNDTPIRVVDKGFEVTNDIV